MSDEIKMQRKLKDLKAIKKENSKKGTDPFKNGL